jgi:hypothetical protein
MTKLRKMECNTNKDIRSVHENLERELARPRYRWDKNIMSHDVSE